MGGANIAGVENGPLWVLILDGYWGIHRPSNINILSIWVEVKAAIGYFIFFNVKSVKLHVRKPLKLQFPEFGRFPNWLGKGGQQFAKK